MATEPLSTRNSKKQAYKALWIIPLHIKHPGVAIPVQNLNISQQFAPDYKREDVYGRMDPIATYSKTTRTMRIGFSCQAHHLIDGLDGVIDNIQTINEVTQMLYPAYEEAGTGAVGKPAILKAPPFFRIKFGQYFGSFSYSGDEIGEGITGFITGFQHGIGKVATNMAYGGQGADSPIRALPREIKVSFSFQVVHDKSVGWTQVGDKRVFSADGYGANFPYNTGLVETDATGAKKGTKTTTPTPADAPNGAGATTPKVDTKGSTKSVNASAKKRTQKKKPPLTRGQKPQ